MSDVLQKLRDHILAHEITGNGETRLIGHVRQAAAELTRLRAELDWWQHAAKTGSEALGEARRDLAAAQEREQRMREALETARGLYQVTHIHAAIDAALGEPQ